MPCGYDLIGPRPDKIKSSLHHDCSCHWVVAHVLSREGLRRCHWWHLGGHEGPGLSQTRTHILVMGVFRVFEILEFFLTFEECSFLVLSRKFLLNYKIGLIANCKLWEVGITWRVHLKEFTNTGYWNLRQVLQGSNKILMPQVQSHNVKKFYTWSLS